MAINSVEQGRAAFAYRAAKKGSQLGKASEQGKQLNKKASDKKASEYKSYVKKIPMLIKTNGLGAAFSFVFAKGTKDGAVQLGTAYGLIYDQTAEWIITEKPYLMPNLQNRGDFAKEIMNLNSSEYRALTVEVIALFTWLRRFAEGLI